MDINGHLNNVAFAALFESGRVMMNRHVRPIGERAANERTMVAAIEINYLVEGVFRTRLRSRPELAAPAPRAGRSSRRCSRTAARSRPATRWSRAAPTARPGRCGRRWWRTGRRISTEWAAFLLLRGS